MTLCPTRAGPLYRDSIRFEWLPSGIEENQVEVEGLFTDQGLNNAQSKALTQCLQKIVLRRVEAHDLETCLDLFVTAFIHTRRRWTQRSDHLLKNKTAVAEDTRMVCECKDM